MGTTRKPDAIVHEIEQTRAELAETIDAISERLNPRRAASRGARVVREQVAAAMPAGGTNPDAAVAGGDGPRPAVIAAAGAAAVVAGVVAVRRRR